jgi:peptidoglycan/LPS O-acetylase OafA/YrhL
MLDRLRRTTNQGSFIPEIDGLRFFAIMTVVLFHLNTTYANALGQGKHSYVLLNDSIPWLGWCFMRLDLGVKVFFGISGFILSLPFLRHYLLGQRKVDVGDYFLRRLKRLEPPFLVSFAALFAAQSALSLLDVDRPLSHLLVGLLYSHVIVYGEANPINPVTWSLETEAQFYIVVPLLFRWLFKPSRSRSRIFILLLLVGLSILFRQYVVKNDWYHLQNTVLAYLSNFLMGTVMAWMYLAMPEYFRRKSYGWDLAGALAVWLMFGAYKPQHDPLHNAAFNVSIIGLFFAVFKGRAFNAFFTWQPVYTIGGMCYSIYLLHYAFLFAVVPRTSGLTSALPYPTGLSLQLLLVVPFMLVLTSVFYLLIEKPCMDKEWPRKAIEWLRARTRKPVRA